MTSLRANPGWLPKLPLYLGIIFLATALNIGLFTYARYGHGIAIMLPANGIMLGMILISAPHQRWAWIAARMSVALMSSVRANGTLATATIFVLASGLETGLAAMMTRPQVNGLRDIGEPAGMRSFVLWGVLFTPLLVQGVACGVVSLISARSFASMVTLIVPASATGVLVATPLVLAVSQTNWAEPFTGENRRRNLLAFGACLLCTAAVFLQDRYRLLFLPVPLMLLVAAMMGPSGAAVLVACLALAISAFTAAGFGPLASPSFAPWEAAGQGQLLLVVAVLITFPVAQAIAARRRADIALQVQAVGLARSERLFRNMAEYSSDIITRGTPDGHRLYLSPSVETILGYSAEALDGLKWEAMLHPDDTQVFPVARARLLAGDETFSGGFRFRHKNGAWIWLDARLTAIRDPAGNLLEILSNIRDITAQKDLEAALAQANADLLLRAESDGLTGLANRRRFDEQLHAEWQRAMRNRTAIGLLMIDVDHFKSYNDAAGHQAGDACLRAVAQAIGGILRRPGDLAARYGGEEFVVLLPETDSAGSVKIAERMRAALATCALAHPGTGGIVTVSIGVADCVPLRHSSHEALLGRADHALYEAKRQGRDRIMCDEKAAVGDNIIRLLGGQRAGDRRSC